MSDYRDRSEIPELDSLPREIEPPPEVEERIVGELSARGLIGRAPGRGAVWWQLAAAVLLAAVVGWTARGLLEPVAAPEIAQREFLLLLSEPEPLQTTKSEAELVGEYSAWAQGLAQENRFAGAGKLENREVLLKGSPVAASPDVSGSLDTVTGYFLVRAMDWGDALEIARSCPHLAYGGDISVRALDPNV
jgi:hypothetical protein